jgi:hypothetical protein
MTKKDVCVPAGGRDEAAKQARKNPDEEPAEAVPAGGQDLAKEAALEGKQDGLSRKS